MPAPRDDQDFDELLRTVRDLARRVERLEQRVSDELAGVPEDGYVSAAPHRVPAPRQPPAQGALESKIGSQWLNRIGVVAVLFGVAYLLRYAFLSHWISPAAWIWMGVGAGISVIVASEAFRRRGYRVLSLSLKATGIGVSYLSLWAGFELYRLLSGPEAFTGLVLLTVVGAALALRESAEVLAGLALIAGFLTPLLIAIPAGEAPLFVYIFMLDGATSAMALRRYWWKVVPLSFGGTVVLSAVWYFEHYRRPELAAAMAAATVFFGVFCVTALWGRPAPDGRGAPRLLTFIELANPAWYFAGIYVLAADVAHDALALPAILLATLYFGLAWRAERHGESAASPRVGLYGALGIGFLAAALAIALNSDWLSLGWFVEAAAVMAIGFWRDLPWLRWGALLLLCATVVKAFAYDVWQLGLGYRTLSFIGLGVLLLGISFAYQRYGFSIVAKSGKGSAGRR